MNIAYTQQLRDNTNNHEDKLTRVFIESQEFLNRIRESIKQIQEFNKQTQDFNEKAREYLNNYNIGNPVMEDTFDSNR